MKNVSNITKTTPSIDENFHTFLNSEQIQKIAIPYFIRLHKIVMTEKITNQELTKAVEELETEIYNDRNIDNKELVTFFSYSNVAKFSDLYREQNTSNWESISLNAEQQEIFEL